MEGLQYSRDSREIQRSEREVPEEATVEQITQHEWQGLIESDRDPLALPTPQPMAWPRQGIGFSLSPLNTGIALINHARATTPYWLEAHEVASLTEVNSLDPDLMDDSLAASFREFSTRFWLPVYERGELQLDGNGAPVMEVREYEEPQERVYPVWNAGELNPAHIRTDTARALLEAPLPEAPQEEIGETLDEREYFGLVQALETVFRPYLAQRLGLHVDRFTEALNESLGQDRLVLTPYDANFGVPDGPERRLFVILPENTDPGAACLAAAGWVLDTTHRHIHDDTRAYAQREGREFNNRGFFGRPYPRQKLIPALTRAVAALLGSALMGRIPAMPVSEHEPYRQFQSDIAAGRDMDFDIRQVLTMAPRYLMAFGGHLAEQQLAPPRNLWSGDSPYGTPGLSDRDIRDMLNL